LERKKEGARRFVKGEKTKKQSVNKKSDFSFFLLPESKHFFSTSTPLNSAFGGLYPVTNQLTSTVSAMTN